MKNQFFVLTGFCGNLNKANRDIKKVAVADRGYMSQAVKMTNLKTNCLARLDLGGHPKPASRGHLKTGQLKT